MDPSTAGSPGQRPGSGGPRGAGGGPGRVGAGWRRLLVDGALCVLAGLLVLMGLTGLTLSREEGLDADGGRAGNASVGQCRRYGPVSGSGLGFWWDCAVDVAWEDGTAGRYRTRGSLFAPGDRAVPVRQVHRGGRGNLDAATHLVRPDRPPSIGMLVAGLGLLVAGGLAGLRPAFDALRAVSRVRPSRRRH
ncbi:MAG TPA: DUF6346 domain-containing protein [Pilimelia sp.]|nr:DUF6346 domain-containing protein [Pilimelia sp.]